MSSKKQKKAKTVKFLHTAADKIGKFMRKAVPVAGTIVGVSILKNFLSGKDRSNKA